MLVPGNIDERTEKTMTFTKSSVYVVLRRKDSARLLKPPCFLSLFPLLHGKQVVLDSLSPILKSFCFQILKPYNNSNITLYLTLTLQLYELDLKCDLSSTRVP